MKLAAKILLAVFVLGVLVAGCIAVVNDEDSLGPIRLVSHEQGCDPDYEPCEDEGRRKETCFMFCDNIIVIPGLPGQEDPLPDGRARTSLFPPTPEKIFAGIQAMADAGINLGTQMARLVVDYVIGVMRFVV